jgi:hypothetical protein
VEWNPPRNGAIPTCGDRGQYAGYPQIPSAATTIERITGNVRVIYDELP